MGKAKLKVVLLRFTPDADELTAMAARLFAADPALRGADFNRRTVGIVGTHIEGFMTHHAHGTGKNIGLNDFDHVAEMNGTVGIR